MRSGSSGPAGRSPPRRPGQLHPPGGDPPGPETSSFGGRGVGPHERVRLGRGAQDGPPGTEDAPLRRSETATPESPRSIATQVRVVPVPAASWGPTAEADALVWTDPRPPTSSFRSWWGPRPVGSTAPGRRGGLVAAGHWTPTASNLGQGISGRRWPSTLSPSCWRGPRLHRYVRAGTWLPPEAVPTRRLRSQRVLIVGTAGSGRALAACWTPSRLWSWP